jgi:hypothetical protein
VNPGENGTVETPVFWAAVDMAKAGYPVFPAKDKAPSVEGGFYAGTADVSQVAEWINEGFEDHEVTFATGLPSSVVVMDTDTPEATAEMESSYGPPHVRTKHGAHWYFRHPRNGKATSKRLRPGLDRKGDGGYVVAPPSPGRTWTNGMPDRTTLPALPREFWPKKAEKSDAPRSMSQDLKEHAAEMIAGYVREITPNAPTGGRHEHLTHLCGVLLARKVPRGDAEDILLAAWKSRAGTSRRGPIGRSRTRSGPRNRPSPRDARPGYRRRRRSRPGCTARWRICSAGGQRSQ